MTDRNTLPHEFTHSWNGKYRRPANLTTPDYATPMQNDLLWVYEGQTQFWGYVLGARAGLYTKQQTLDALASIAGRLDTGHGREWRPLVDTTDDPIIDKRRPQAWWSWQRNEDYYNEGMMVWLEADAILRRETRGAKGMDDFARAFFGMNDGDRGVLTYTRQDVIDALSRIAPYDWDGFFKARVDQPTSEVTKGGFALGGYKLSYGETPGSTDKTRETNGKMTDQSYGVGLVVNDNGNVEAALWDSPAFAAGMTVGTRIVAINGEEYSAKLWRQALKETADGKHPLSLIIKQAQRYRNITLAYSGGIRYPRLEKTGGGETSLDRLLKPRTREAQGDQPIATGPLMNIDLIPVGANPPESLNVIIEVPTGGEPVKYEFDKASGALFVDRILHTPMRYPRQLRLRAAHALARRRPPGRIGRGALALRAGLRGARTADRGAQPGRRAWRRRKADLRPRRQDLPLLFQCPGEGRPARHRVRADRAFLHPLQGSRSRQMGPRRHLGRGGGSAEGHGRGDRALQGKQGQARRGLRG